MFEIDQEQFTIDELKQAAIKFDMDFTKYMEKMKAKGLKEVKKSTDTDLDITVDTASEPPPTITSSRTDVKKKEKERKEKKDTSKVNKFYGELQEKLKNVAPETIDSFFKNTYFDLANLPTKAVKGQSFGYGAGGSTFESIPIEEYLGPELYQQYEQFLEGGTSAVIPLNNENEVQITAALENAKKGADKQTTQDFVNNVPDHIRKIMPNSGGKYEDIETANKGLELIANGLKFMYEDYTKSQEDYAKINKYYKDEVKEITDEIYKLTGDDGKMEGIDSPKRIKQYNDLVTRKKTLISNYNQEGLNTVYNKIVLEGQKLESAFEDFKNKSEDLDDRQAIEKALGLDYKFSTRAGIALEEFFGGNLVDFSLLTAQVGVKIAELGLNTLDFWFTDEFDPVQFDETINYLSTTSQNYNAKLAEKRNITIPEAYKLDDIGREGVSYWDWTKNAFAENQGSIITSFIAGGATLLGRAGIAAAGKSIAKRRIALKRNRNLQKWGLGTAQSVFFVAETGGKYGDIELNAKNANEQLPLLRAQLAKTEDLTERTELEQDIEDLETKANYTLSQKAFTSYGSGTVAVIAETVGTLKFVQGATSMISKIGRNQFKKDFYEKIFKFAPNVIGKTLSGLPKLTTQAVGINVIEEGLTVIGHNAFDRYVLKENKSLLEGLDKDFLGNTIIATSGMLAPRAMGNIVNIYKGEVATRENVLNNQKLVGELIQLQIDKQNGLKGKDRLNANKRQNEILVELGLNDALNLHKLRYLSPEQIKEVGDINRRIHEVQKEYGQLGYTGDTKSDKANNAKERLNKRLKELIELKESILNTGKKINLEETKRLSELHKNTFNNANATYDLGLYNYYSDIALTLQPKDGDYIVIKSEEDFKLLDKYDDATKNEIIEGYYKFSNGVNVNNDIIIFDNNIKAKIATRLEGANYASIAPLEELLHIYNKSKNIVDKNGELNKQGKSAVEQAITLFKEKKKLGTIKLNDKDFNDLLDRFELYRDTKGKLDYEEILVQFNNASALGILNISDFINMPSLRQMINGLSNEILGDASWMLQMKSSEDVFNFIQNYQKTIEGEIAIEGSEEDDRIKESKESENIDALVGPKTDGKYTVTKAQWKGGESQKVLSNIFPLLQGLIKSKIPIQKPPGFSEEDFISGTITELIPHIRNFNPEQNNSLSGWINPFLKYKIGNVLKKDEAATKPVFETDITEAKDIAVEETPTFTQEKTIRSKLRRDLKIDKPLIDKVKQAVRKTFGTKLPAIESKEFKQALQKAYRTELKTPIAELLGTRESYKKFLEDNFEGIYKALPQDILNKRFRQFAEDTGQREKTPEGKKIFKKRSIDKQEFIDYFLGPKVGTSTKGTRKDALAEALGEIMALDATMEVIQEPEVKAKREAIVGLDKDQKVTPTDKAKIAKIIDRDPVLKFSLSTKRDLNFKEDEAGNLEATFNVKDKKYDIEISSKDMEGTAYEVDFYLKTKDGRTQDITKTGDQFEVLGIVYNGILDFIKQNPNVTDIGFASKAEPSRIRLYKSITNALAKKLKWKTEYYPSYSNNKLEGFDFNLEKPGEGLSYQDFETDRANILSVIDRDPYLKFSLALTPDQRIEFNKKGVNIVSGINNAIDNQGLSVFKATLFSLTENLRDFNIPQEELIKFAKQYAPAVKKFIKNLNKKLVTQSEFGKVTQEDVEKTLLSYAIGDALGLSETAGSLFDNKKPMEKYDGKTHVEEFRRVYKDFVLNQINKKGDLPGLIDILKFYKDFNTTAGIIGSGKGGTNRYQAFEGSKDFFDFINENLKDKGIKIKINKTGTGWVPVNIEINKVKQFENTKELNKVLKLRPQKNNLSESEIEKNYLLGEKEAGQAFDAMVDYLGYVKKHGDKAQFGMSLMALKSNMNALGKRVAYPKYFYVGKAKGPIRFEHMYPSLVLAKDMIDHFYSDKKVDLETIKKNQLVAMIPLEMDKRINILHQDSFPSWWNIKMGVLPRYYNALNKGYKDMYTLKSLGGKDKGKIYGKEFLPLNKSIQKATISNKEKLPKLVKFSKAVINQEVLNEMAVLDTEQSEAQMKFSKGVAQTQEQSIKTNKALLNEFGINIDELSTGEIIEKLNILRKAKSEASNTRNPTKKGRVFDFDDTLAKTKSKVLYTLPDGTKGSLDAAQFAKQYESLKEAGVIFDYSEFKKVKDGTKGPLANLAKRFTEALGDRDVFILTSRPAGAAAAIQKFLRSTLGVSIPLKNITGLENATPGAKAMWIAEKVSEGYNDIFFADDSKANVVAVEKMLTELGVTKRVQQVKFSKSQNLSDDFNKILENRTGIGAEKIYSDVKAQVIGANKGKFNFFIPPSAEDFVGLLYKTLGKGKLGDTQMAWYKKNLLNPFARAMDNLSRDRIALMNDFKALKKDLKIVPKNLKKKLPGEPFTQEQAIRTYIWNKQGMSPEGMSKADLKELTDFVESKPELVLFADQLIAIQKGDSYPPPKFGWLAGSITTDLMDGINTIKRTKYLEQWQYNVDEIFTNANLNKLEAAYGKGYRTALEGILKRMRTGRNREFNSDTLTGRVTDWLTNSIGAIMFFNTRSAVLQTISAANFINFKENNIFAAGKAFANQPQFWKDFIMLFNSDFLLDRRNGLKLNVNEADIADMAKKGGVRGVISKILRLGFLPTQIADSFAIASGGSTFYRNKVKSLEKQGLSKKEAEIQAFQEFREIAEESQQSSRPDRISQQQAGPLGRIILAFANTPMQYTRLIKKAASDLKNRRGDTMTNISKIFYYGFVQNLLFNAMQQALFAMGFGDEEEETEKREEKYANIANSMGDSILRGMGIGGAIVSVLKNTAIKLNKESDKKRPKYQDVLTKEIAQISPPVSSKLSKLRAAGRSYSWNKKEMIAKGFSLDSPAYLAAGQVISATTNIPLDRAFKKINNIINASNSDLEAWQRIASLAGWSDWELGIKKSKPKTIKFTGKKVKNKKVKKKKVKKKKKKKSKTKF